jgi:hypothetical protein
VIAGHAHGGASASRPRVSCRHFRRRIPYSPAQRNAPGFCGYQYGVNISSLPKLSHAMSPPPILGSS